MDGRYGRQTEGARFKFPLECKTCYCYRYRTVDSLLCVLCMQFKSPRSVVPMIISPSKAKHLYTITSKKSFSTWPRLPPRNLVRPWRRRPAVDEARSAPRRLNPPTVMSYVCKERIDILEFILLFVARQKYTYSYW
jgi:hypothetical protein